MMLSIRTRMKMYCLLFFNMLWNKCFQDC